MPVWLARIGMAGGAALLKKHLKEKGKELVGEARKKAIAKLAKKTKKKEKKKEKKKKDKKTDKKKYKITSKSFKKKPMTEKQARHATRPGQKKYKGEHEWTDAKGKKQRLPASHSEPARAKGINILDRFDAPQQRVGPQRLPKKKGKTKIIKMPPWGTRSRWVEEYK